MSIDWFDLDLGDGDRLGPQVQVMAAPGLPPPHPAEADLFVRHKGVPAHDQEALAEARILLIGAGGLGSWVGVALARSGARNITIADGDRYDRTNAPRQLTFGDDLQTWKAHALARNLVPHMIAGGYITAIAAPFPDACDRAMIATDIIITMVDNNECRLEAVQYARHLGIPAVYSMLSLDGMRVHTFLQGPSSDDACLWCAAPNLDPAGVTPCAASVITSCFVSAAHATFFAHRALMGWPDGQEPFNWRTTDLLGNEPEQIARVARRDDCPACGLVVPDGRSDDGLPMQVA